MIVLTLIILLAAGCLWIIHSFNKPYNQNIKRLQQLHKEGELKTQEQYLRRRREGCTRRN